MTDFWQTFVTRVFPYIFWTLVASTIMWMVASYFNHQPSGNFFESDNGKRSPFLDGEYWRLEERGDHFCVLYNFLRPFPWASSNEGSYSRKGVAANAAEEEPVLCTHSTLDRVRALLDQVQHWDGAHISLALYLRPDEEGTAAGGGALGAFTQLWHCSEASLRQKLRVHLVWKKQEFRGKCLLLEPSNEPNEGMEKVRTKWPKAAGQQNPSEFGWCPAPAGTPSVVEAELFDTVLAEASPVPALDYPINLLRNVARLGAPRHLPAHIVTDVEQVFSANFSQNVRKIVTAMTKNPWKKKTVYMIRRFELASNYTGSPVLTLEQLRELHSSGQARAFHERVFPEGHNFGPVDEWLRWSDSGDKNVRNRLFRYRNPMLEAQLLLPARAPLHFEPAPARFYDHQFLMIELCRAGYHFELLSNVFSVHPGGIKTEYGTVEKLVNEIGLKLATRNNVLTRFRAHLDAKYGPNQRKKKKGRPKCPIL